MKDRYIENKMLNLILACPGFGYASKSTVYVDGPDQWKCGHWEGSPDCQCQGYFYTVQHWDDVEVFSSFDDAMEFIRARDCEDENEKETCQNCNAPYDYVIGCDCAS